MPNYVILANWTDQGIKNVKECKTIWGFWNRNWKGRW